MKTNILLVAALLGLAQIVTPAVAQHHHTQRHHKMRKHTKPKSEITELRMARKRDHTVRQITPDPKKSPGKHADNLSKNVNHEINRESKDVNHFFQGKH